MLLGIDEASHKSPDDLNACSSHSEASLLLVLRLGCRADQAQ